MPLPTHRPRARADDDFALAPELLLHWMRTSPLVYLGDVLLAVDTLMEFARPYFDDGRGVLVTNAGFIFRRYLLGSFKYDLLSVLPLELILDERTLTGSSFKCDAHSDCAGSTPFCNDGTCESCDQCKLCSDGIDGTCGACGVGYPTDEPPCSGQYEHHDEDLGSNSKSSRLKRMTSRLLTLILLLRLLRLSRLWRITARIADRGFFFVLLHHGSSAAGAGGGSLSPSSSLSSSSVPEATSVWRVLTSCSAQRLLQLLLMLILATHLAACAWSFVGDLEELRYGGRNILEAESFFMSQKAEEGVGGAWLKHGYGWKIAYEYTSGRRSNSLERNLHMSWLVEMHRVLPFRLF